MKKQILLLFTVLLIFAGYFISCGDDDVMGETSFYLSGYLIDSITQQGLDSATISIGDTLAIDAYTDSNGFYEYAALGGSVKTVFARKEGYQTKFKEVDLSTNPEDVNFELVIE